MKGLWLSFDQDPRKHPSDGKSVTWPVYIPGQRKMAVFAETGKTWFQLGDENLTGS